MISGALRPTHSSCNLHFMQFTAPDKDVVDEAPVFGSCIHPKSLVHDAELEEVCDGKAHFRANREKSTGDRYYSCCRHRDDQ